MQNYFSTLLDYIQEKRWLSHLLFWLAILLIQTLGVESLYNGKEIFIHKVIVLPTKILAAYVLIYYQLPEFLYKKRYVLFFISFIISSYVFSVIARIVVVHGVEELIRPKPFAQEPIYEIITDYKALYARYYLGVYFPALIMLMLKLIKEKFNERNEIKQLEKEKVSAELSFLKAQIHPHFLFNTLNNLYVLTIKKSDKAPETVLKLSEILDYMLYQCNDPEISIEKEIQLIENYVALEQLRYGKKLSLNFVKEVDNLQTKISPLLLISIIENAFKHGVSGASATSEVSIDLKVKENQLTFKVYNTKPLVAQKDYTNFKKGIGLKNTRKQLALIYPEKGSIEVVDKASNYTVLLKIDLSK